MLLIKTLTDTQKNTIRAALEKLHLQSHHQVMNPDLHFIEAQTHEMIIENCTDLLEWLEDGHEVSLGYAERMQLLNQAY